jgi:hypothetical protein
MIPGVPLGSRLREALSSNDIRAGLGRVISTCINERLFEGSSKGITAQTAEGVIKLEYYKNCMMHWVISPAIAALAEANKDYDPEDTLIALHSLFSDTFLLPAYSDWAPKVKSLQADLRSRKTPSPAAWTRATYLLLPYFEVFAEALDAAGNIKQEGITEESFFNNLRNRVSLNFGLRTEARATSTLGPAMNYLIHAHFLVRNRASGGRTSILFPGSSASKLPSSPNDLAHNADSCEDFIKAQVKLTRSFGQSIPR